MVECPLPPPYFTRKFLPSEKMRQGKLEKKRRKLWKGRRKTKSWWGKPWKQTEDPFLSLTENNIFFWVYQMEIPGWQILCKWLIAYDAQGRSQPHSPGWARFPLSSLFLKFWSFFLIFPQTFLLFFLILSLRVGDSPTREDPGYATDDAVGHCSCMGKKSCRTTPGNCKWRGN